MSDWIVSMRVVDGAGNIKKLPPESLPDGVTVTDDQILKAAQVCLGLFGVVIEYTVKVQPMSNSKVWNIFDMSMKVLLQPITCTVLLHCIRMTLNYVCVNLTDFLFQHRMLFHQYSLMAKRHL